MKATPTSSHTTRDKQSNNLCNLAVTNLSRDKIKEFKKNKIEACKGEWRDYKEETKDLN